MGEATARNNEGGYFSLIGPRKITRWTNAANMTILEKKETKRPTLEEKEKSIVLVPSDKKW